MRGLGWVLFSLAKSQAAALVQAEQAEQAGPEWPGAAPRKVRIVERQNEECQPDGDGERLVIHKLDGRSYRWPEQWTAKRALEEEVPGVHI